MLVKQLSRPSTRCKRPIDHRAEMRDHGGMMRNLLAIVALIVVVASPVVAQDFDKGLAARKRGDYITAMRELKLLAEHGHARAQFNLGLMYEIGGGGVSQDYAEALKWFRKAAEQGYARAQDNLGSMYDFGKGVPLDYGAALKWYRMAAGQGYAISQSNLGSMYSKGDGVPQDYAEALKWFRKAAEQGRAEDQSNLGDMYAKGKGVLQDNVIAHMWFNLAAAQGEMDAATNRSVVGKKMTPSAIEIAQRLARECLARTYKDCGR